MPGPLPVELVPSFQSPKITLLRQVVCVRPIVTCAEHIDADSDRGFYPEPLKFEFESACHRFQPQIMTAQIAQKFLGPKNIETFVGILKPCSVQVDRHTEAVHNGRWQIPKTQAIIQPFYQRPGLENVAM